MGKDKASLDLGTWPVSGGERFFYKDVVSANIAEDSVIVHCRVYDGVQNLDVPVEQYITPEMLKHCRFAHSRYVNDLGNNKKQGVESEKTERERQYGKN